ncbi:MAG: MBL fold metallo-hydrolase [Burkholderiales bacterium]|nr:MBL fold metallo-hydrolase [Burkholderiales bacterium]
MQSAPSPSHRKADLECPFTEAPEAGSVRKVAPGIYWVRMPLPFALEHINLWLLADSEGWTVVDCGYSTNATRAAWERIFAQHLGGRPVTRLIVTHCHPDHIGLCGWLSEKFGLTPWLTQSEYLLAHAYYHRIGGTEHAALVALNERHGLARDRLAAINWREDHYRHGVQTLPGAFRRIRHGDEIAIGGNNWRVIVGHGHSPEHAALHCEKLGVLISGDMLLPRISTNVSVWPMEPEGDPLGEFLASLEQFMALDAGTLVLPSHGLPFRGMASRIEELNCHHRERLDRLVAVCEQPMTAAELLPHLFKRKFDDYQLVFAIGEAIAHLNYLMHRGALQRTEDRDGIHRFVRRVAAAKA